jgi:enoyl-CoA hydratase/carnithine racemase
VQAEVERFAGQSSAIQRLTKRALRETLGLPFEEALAELEAVYLYELMGTEDAREGLRACAENRKPVWRDR